MPVYTVKDPQTGRSVKLTGDSPPSEAELSEIFSKLGPSRSDGGMLEAGNIDLSNRPRVKNADGSISTVRSIGVNMDGQEVLIPTVVNGRVVSNEEAIAAFKQTGQHLGKFRDVASSNAFAQQLHEREAAKLNAPPERTWTDTAKDLAGGVRAGVANTVYGGGDLIRRGLGMDRILDQPDVKAAMTPPNSTPGKLGMAAEQVGEFFIPTGLVGKAAKVAEVVKSGALTAAQTRDPLSTGVSAAVAAIPFGGLAQKASSALNESAVETMANSLRATKEWAKSEAEKLAPEMLKRGVGGSIKSLRTQASATAQRVGRELDAAYKAGAAAGQAIPGDVVRGNIQLASDALHTKAASGAKLAIPGNESAIDRLSQLDTFVGALGEQIPVDQAAAIKRAFDAIVSKAGLYGQNATAPASDKAAAWSFREAANAFRDLLNTNPSIEALNKEASFWIGLRDVVDATKLRKVGQTGGLFAAGTGGAGMIAGAMTGDSTQQKAANAVLGGLAGRQLVRVVQSPAFMNRVSAPLKNALANALARGSQGELASVTSRILSSLPAQASANVGP